jgi:pimeloyl-ACP methyl ester carboxylesterase
MDEPMLLRVPGGEIASWSNGNGPHALILHGSPGLGDYTDALAGELAVAYACTRYQQRGSPLTTVGAPYAVETHVADAVAVLDALEVERTLVVGIPGAGITRMHLALAHPERIGGLVVSVRSGRSPTVGRLAHF